MPSMTSRELDALWEGIDDQRTRTARLLEGLSPADWDHPSLCEGWTVRHVAAHLTLQEQTIGDLLGLVARNPRMWRHPGLNGTIRGSADVVAAALTPEEVVARIRAGIGRRRHNAFVTPLETLTDALVHGQDIAVPLGLPLEMRPGPSVLAATRRWDTRRSWLASVNRRLPLDDLCLCATDADWLRGEGLEVVGPVGAILLLLTGRPAALDRLDGPGANALRARLGHRATPPARG